MNDPLPWPIERIIQVAHELKRTGTTAASTGTCQPFSNRSAHFSM